MVNEDKKIVKFDDLDMKAKINCIDQYVGIICPYDYDGNYENVSEDIDYFVEATPQQYWFDQNGDWYDEGRWINV